MKKYFLFYFSLTVLLIPSISFASEIVFAPSSVTIAKDELVKINVYLMLGTDKINAAEGKLIFPSDLLAISNISFGNSILSFWPEEPHKSADGIISFSGVAPGGYSGSRGLLFSVIFKATKEGKAVLEINDGMVLKDDGAGTAAALKLNQGIINIVKKVSNTESTISSALSKEISWKSDTELPETFIPLVGSNPSIFDGKYFLVFATTDKQSGVDYYEVQESKRQSFEDNKWIRAESPYLLTDQALHSFISVKAIDHAGTFRTETLLPEYPQRFYQSSLFWVIIVVIFSVLVFFRRKLFKFLSKHAD